MERPQQYTGFEYNTLPAESGRGVTLVYPDVYELGASNFGLRAVRHILLKAGFPVTRAFHPAPDMYALLKERGLPWLNCETGEPVAASTVVGFGISSEILYSNVLSLIELMGLPLRREDRQGDRPVILAGGGGLSNPVPLMPFVDVLFLGEAEAGLAGVVSILCSDLSLREKLEGVRGMPGVLVPGLHEGERVKWARAASLDIKDAPVDQVVPLARITHDRAVVEISRGCTRGCRFCQASQLARPVRERPPEDVMKLLHGAVQSTGWEKAGLLTLSFSDYSRLDELLCLLEPLEEKMHVQVSQPSLRPDTLPGLQKKRFFKGSLTMAPEAGTERLRRIINKPLTDGEIMEAAGVAARMGARGIKLYFMVGLPGETDEDLLAIARMADAISGLMGKKRKVSAALSPFIPKPHTPFQWCSPPDQGEMWRRISLVREACGRAAVSWNDPRVSAVEHFLSTGDETAGDALEKAFRLGAVFDGWSDLFRWDIWRDLIPDSPPLAPEPGAPLPWDFVDTGVDRGWLIEEYRRTGLSETLPDCRASGCTGCGACSGTVPPLPAAVFSGASGKGRDTEPKALERFRIRYAKRGLAVYTSHLDMVRMWTRTLRRSGLPLHYTSGYSRRVKLAFSQPIPLGMGSESEYTDFLLDEPVHLGKVVETLRKALPKGFSILAARRIPVESKPPDSIAFLAEYIISGIDRLQLLEDYLEKNETGVSFRSLGRDGAIMVSSPAKGASRPDRVMEAAGVEWGSIVRTELFKADEGGQLIPLLRAVKGEFE